MEKKEISAVVEAQRKFFASNATLSVKFRKEYLKNLKTALLKNEAEISAAIKKDLGKSSFESFMCETGMVIDEINFMLKHLSSLAKKKRVHTPISQFASNSYTISCPYGVTLIMSPWNYPLLLTLDPLVDSIAAGNTAVLKPSAYSPATSAVIQKITESVFPKEYVAVITGGREENAHLLDEKFDYIFFTGSKAVGKEVMAKAARHITPLTLELGGKSPCIIDSGANIKLAAKRIAFGKYLNCGQTCVAPDYILCEKSVKDKFLSFLKSEITEQYGNEPLQNENFGRIINEKHFSRICALINNSKTVYGGKFDADSLKIEPTVMDNVTPSDAVMQEEIFGPILPILTFDDIDEAISFVNKREKPLALYIFSSNKKNIKKVTSLCSFGGGCINDVVVHIATSSMGFGGVGESGIGAYHGKAGFDAFSHSKSIMDKKTWLDIPLRYQPYTKSKEKFLKKLFK